MSYGSMWVVSRMGSTIRMSVFVYILGRSLFTTRRAFGKYESEGPFKTVKHAPVIGVDIVHLEVDGAEQRLQRRDVERGV